METKDHVHIKALMQQAPEGIETVFELQKALQRDDHGQEREVPALVISRRQLQPEQEAEAQFGRTPPAAHTFYAVNGFIDYLDRYGTPSTVVLVDPQAQRVQAILSESKLKHSGGEEEPVGNRGGRTVIKLEPQVHPRWEPWRQLLNQRLPIMAFVDFLRMNRRSIASPDGRELTLALAQIRCSTEVVLHRGTGKEAVNGLITRTSIRGKEDSQHVDLPEEFTVRTPLWVDTPEVEVRLDLILNANKEGSEVMAQIASADLREAEVAAFDQLTEKLRSAWGKAPDITVAHGRVGNGSWLIGDPDC